MVLPAHTSSLRKNISARGDLWPPLNDGAAVLPHHELFSTALVATLFLARVSTDAQVWPQKALRVMVTNMFYNAVVTSNRMLFSEVLNFLGF